MATKPKYTREYKDRHGLIRLEFHRKEDKTRPLRQTLRSAEFWEDYNAAAQGNIPPGNIRKHGSMPHLRETTKPQSFRWLIEEYKTSAAFIRLSARTQNVRKGNLDDLSI